MGQSFILEEIVILVENLLHTCKRLYGKIRPVRKVTETDVRVKLLQMHWGDVTNTQFIEWMKNKGFIKEK